MVMLGFEHRAYVWNRILVITSALLHLAMSIVYDAFDGCKTVTVLAAPLQALSPHQQTTSCHQRQVFWVVEG